jgi:hypothetical protein
MADGKLNMHSFVAHCKRAWPGRVEMRQHQRRTGPLTGGMAVLVLAGEDPTSTNANWRDEAARICPRRRRYAIDRSNMNHHSTHWANRLGQRVNRQFLVAVGDRLAQGLPTAAVPGAIRIDINGVLPPVLQTVATKTRSNNLQIEFHLPADQAASEVTIEAKWTRTPRGIPRWVVIGAEWIVAEPQLRVRCAPQRAIDWLCENSFIRMAIPLWVSANNRSPTIMPP